MQVMPNLVSVLCVSYNQAAYSAAALRSVFDQSCRDLELVIVDDGSTDGNPDIIRETLKDSPFPRASSNRPIPRTCREISTQHSAQARAASLPSCRSTICCCPIASTASLR